MKMYKSTKESYVHKATKCPLCLGQVLLKLLEMVFYFSGFIKYQTNYVSYPAVQEETERERKSLHTSGCIFGQCSVNYVSHRYI